MNKNNDTKRQNTMKTQTTKTHLALYASGILTCFSGTAGATTIFTEDFNSFTGVLNGNARGAQGQAITTHDLAHSGNVTGWSNAGAGTIHAVDTANVWTDPLDRYKQSAQLGGHDLGRKRSRCEYHK